MASAEDVLHHRKRRRRRRVDKPPISAHLVLDERMKDDVGILSEDLFADFFPGANRAGTMHFAFRGVRAKMQSCQSRLKTVQDHGVSIMWLYHHGSLPP